MTYKVFYFVFVIDILQGINPYNPSVPSLFARVKHIFTFDTESGFQPQIPSH